LWLQKLNPVENESAVRAANAARARIMMEKKDTESESYLATFNEVMDYSFEDLVEYLAAYAIAMKAEALEAEYAEEKGWIKEDYLQGLRDAWEDGGLKERFEKDSEDEEAKKVSAELARFEHEVNLRMDQERKALAKDYSTRPRTELEQMIMDQIYKLQADMQWMVEYHKQELFWGAREADDHKQKYFQTRAEIDELEGEVLTRLIDAFAEMEVSVTQGKGSPQKEDSSSASSSQEKEMAGASGQKG
jgi:hypothetical protein